MDGPGELDRRVAETLGAALAPLVALVVLLLLLACTAELLRRAGRAERVTAALDRATPAVLRRGAVLACGAASAVLGVASAHASETPVRDWLTSTTVPISAPAASTSTTSTTLPPPSRPTQPAIAPAAPPRTPAAIDAVSAGYVVRPGDCLWTIAQRHLAPTATDLEIDAGWRRLYAANVETIGPDPNLVFPGAVLRLPPLAP
jgi:nucleoid-associated protein YgaU